MTVLAPVTSLRPAAVTQPRARGDVLIRAKLRAGSLSGASVLDDLAMAGSMKVLFPRPSGAALDAMLINTAGGVTGGDRFDIRAEAGPGTTLTLTTQAAERAYAAVGREPGRLTTKLRAEAGARLNWLPQETILFNALNFERRLTIDLEESSSLLMVEPLIFGRLAMGEELRQGRFHDRVMIRRAGRPLYLDAVSLGGDIAATLDRPAVARGGRAMAAVVYVAPDAEAHLDHVRALLPAAGGASLLAGDILVMRIVAPDGFRLRKSLVPIIRRLNSDEIPRPWML